MIPNIKQNDIFWEGSIVLEEWNELFDKNLELVLNIGGDSIIDEVTKVHENGYHYLQSNQKEIFAIFLKSIYDKYPQWQTEYGYDEEEREMLMPDIKQSADLIDLVLPQKIFIMDVEKDGIPYIGIQCHCKWDEEHGLGAMFYQNRIVEIGGADAAFMTWIAEEDKESWQ